MPTVDSANLPAFLEGGLLLITILGNAAFAWRREARLDEFDKTVQGSLSYALPVVAGIGSVVLCLFFYDRCPLKELLAVGGLVGALMGALALVFYDRIKTRNTIQLVIAEPDAQRTIWVITGGENYSQEALSMRNYEPGLHDAELLKRLEVADRVWDRAARVATRTKLTLWNAAGTLLICYALIATALAASLFLDARINHKALQINPVGDCSVLRPKSFCQISFSLHECDSTVHWTTLPPGIGSFVTAAIYRAPEEVKRTTWVTLLATPIHEPEKERQTLLVRLEPEQPEVGGRVSAPLPGRPQGEGFIEALLISDDHSWVCESDSELKGNEPGPILIRHLSANNFSRYNDIVVMGTASREGGVIKDEEDRAARRAGKLASWVANAVGSSKHVYKINLGKYDPKTVYSSSGCSAHDLTAAERRVVLIGVVRKSELSVQELSAQLMTFVQEQAATHETFRLIVEKYRNDWTLERYRPGASE